MRALLEEREEALGLFEVATSKLQGVQEKYLGFLVGCTFLPTTCSIKFFLDENGEERWEEERRREQFWATHSDEYQRRGQREKANQQLEVNHEAPTITESYCLGFRGGFYTVLGCTFRPSICCHRCETILQPGFNCTVRVVRIRAKTRRQGKKPVSDQQNNVVYKCHFCSCENVKRGTPKGHMKEICPPKPKQPSKPKPATASEQGTTDKLEAEKTGEIASPSAAKETSSVAGDPSTPSTMKGLTLLDSKKRKRNKPKPKKPDELEAKSAMVDAQKAEVASTKRRRKGWTTLREIAENNERERTKTFTNFSIPFTL